MTKANSKIRKVQKPHMTIAEVDAPGGIVTKSGKRISGKVVVADGEMGYGDKESLAAMTGDTVSRVSTDSKAGDRAYESALEQYERDPVVEKRKRHNSKIMAKIPAARMSFDAATGLWNLDYLREDRATGLLSSHSKKLTDAQVGYLREQSLSRQTPEG